MAAEEGLVFGCHTVEDCEAQLQKANESKKLTVAEDWAVEAMPTFMFVKDGKILDRVVGAKKEELQYTINKYLATASA